MLSSIVCNKAILFLSNNNILLLPLDCIPVTSSTQSLTVDPAGFHDLVVEGLQNMLACVKNSSLRRCAYDPNLYLIGKNVVHNSILNYVTQYPISIILALDINLHFVLYY